MVIRAPFNSYLLKAAYVQIMQDITNDGIEFSSKDIKIPVFETNNGANLQDYESTTQEFSLTSRLVKLVTELPIHWDVATTNFDISFGRLFGPDDCFLV